MKINTHISHAVTLGLLLSAAGQLRAFDEKKAREDMNRFQRSVKSFQKTWDRYSRCARGKCSEEEKQKTKDELKAAGKTTLRYGIILAGAVVAVVVLHKVMGAKAAKRRAQQAKAKAEAETEKHVAASMRGFERRAAADAVAEAAAATARIGPTIEEAVYEAGAAARKRQAAPAERAASAAAMRRREAAEEDPAAAGPAYKARAKAAEKLRSAKIAARWMESAERLTRSDAEKATLKADSAAREADLAIIAAKKWQGTEYHRRKLNDAADAAKEKASATRAKAKEKAARATRAEEGAKEAKADVAAIIAAYAATAAEED